MKTETILTLAIVAAAAVVGFVFLKKPTATLTTPYNPQSQTNGDDAMWNAFVGMAQVAGGAYAANQNAETQQSYIDYLNTSAAMSGGY